MSQNNFNALMIVLEEYQQKIEGLLKKREKILRQYQKKKDAIIIRKIHRDLS